MLLRSVAQPLPAAAIAVMRPHLEALRGAVEALPQQCADAFRGNAPDLTAADSAVAALQEFVAAMRAQGELRSLSIEEVMRLMTFDFALEQLRSTRCCARCDGYGTPRSSPQSRMQRARQQAVGVGLASEIARNLQLALTCKCIARGKVFAHLGRRQPRGSSRSHARSRRALGRDHPLAAALGSPGKA